VWPEPLKAQVIKKMELAVDFIVAQTKLSTINLAIVQDNVGIDNDLLYPGEVPVEMDAHPYWTEETFQIMGYSNGNTAVRKLRKKWRAEQVVFLFHLNKKGRSYNLSYSFRMDTLFFAERAVMFSQYEDGSSTLAASYVHEILHTFGAGELYFPFDDSQDRVKLAREYFPDDVMLRVDYDLGCLTIGEYTAFRVGWIGSLNEEFKIFNDPG
jgi:hypothetical protein